MARKQKQPQVPTQFKHLRFADSETGDILNFGGFTLAYRCIQKPSDVAGRPNIEVQFAYSECSINDNFDKKEGRNRTYNRLQNQAPDYFEMFDITPQLPEGYEHHIIDLHDGVVDIAHTEFDLPRAVVEQFLTTWAAVLNVGTEESGEGNLLQNLIVTEAGILAISADVLSYTEPAFETVANEVATTVIGFADEAVDALDGIEVNSQNAALIETVRSSLSSIKDLCSTMAAASASDEEEDGEEDDEADILDTDEDDGGPADDEEGDDDEEDDEEGDEESDDEQS
jgi:hypothetical protein